MSSETILVVDDNEANRDMLSRRLEKQGYRVITAEGGAEALDLIREFRCDLALLDVMMPEVSGLDALREVRKTLSLADLPVIMVTANSQRDDVVQALGLGANDYVTKPVDFPVLLARVKTHLELHRLSVLKDEFMAIASHDLKNPLTEVIGVASLVQSMVPPGTPMPEDMHDLMRSMVASARRMQGIVEDFLDFQALADGHLEINREPLDLREVVREAEASNTSYAASKEMRLELVLPETLQPVMADRARIRQVVQNLVDNALKYGNLATSVRIEVAPVDKGVEVAVYDHGPGVAEQDVERVFDKWVRLKTQTTGGEKSSGLGLNICRQLVDLHGGKIGVRHNPAGGATFWFTLPYGANPA